MILRKELHQKKQIKEKNYTIKQMEKTRKSLENRLEKIT